MPDREESLERQARGENERDLERRREQELRDLETERTIGPRPLEGFSGAHTTWPPEQDDREAGPVHGHDEAESRARSEAQIPRHPGDRTRPRGNR